MVVLSMNSKRQRRPNVRLGDIGDLSAAFACGISQRHTNNLRHMRWRHEFLNTEETGHNPRFGFSEPESSEFAVLDPGVSPRISADMQQNRENKDPNSSKLGSELPSSDEVDLSKSKLNFGTITRKCRLMKRRGWSLRGKSNVFGSVWNNESCPEISSEYGKEYGVKEFVGFASNSCYDIYPLDGFKDPSDHDTSATSKDACENDMDEPTLDAQQQGIENEFWKEGACNASNDAFLKSGGGCDEMGIGSIVYSVKRWLEDLGFGRYASVFEMHEVDEEALPLLTFEDLKEMGVLAVGPRRKLYNAIRKLQDGCGVGVSA